MKYRYECKKCGFVGVNSYHTICCGKCGSTSLLLSRFRDEDGGVIKDIKVQVGGKDISKNVKIELSGKKVIKILKQKFIDMQAENEKLKSKLAESERMKAFYRSFSDDYVKKLKTMDRLVGDAVKRADKKVPDLEDYIANLVPECSNCHWRDNYNQDWGTNMCDGCKILDLSWKHK